MCKSKTHTDADFFKINHAKTTSKIDINQFFRIWNDITNNQIRNNLNEAIINFNFI